MQSRSSKWMSGVGAVVLAVGGLVLAGCGGGDAPAGAQQAGQAVNLSGLPQNWDKTLPAATRFVLLLDFASAAVRDNETGLVWEQSPLTTTHVWSNARVQCTSRLTGGRKGWRLPSVHELASLIDPTVVFPGLTLPAGHPFINVQSADYWSATTSADGPAFAWFVDFGSGVVGVGSKTNGNLAWCVRGGMNADVY